MVRRNGVFAVNILSAEQEPLSRYFASRDRPRGRDAFRAVAHREEVTGCPILEGAAGYLDCAVHAEHEAGDHLIFIGEVLALGTNPDTQPLLFHGGQYRFLWPSD
jgi:flavin reductase (DIM6/NTAB) family NADH-FMN oxidoreductase RutF